YSYFGDTTLALSSWTASSVVRQASLPLRLTLANERRFFADVDQRELRGLEEADAAEHETADTPKAQNQPQPHERAEPYFSLKRSENRPEQCYQRCRGKRAQRHVDGVESAQEQHRLFLDAIHLLNQTRCFQIRQATRIKFGEQLVHSLARAQHPI